MPRLFHRLHTLAPFGVLILGTLHLSAPSSPPGSGPSASDLAGHATLRSAAIERLAAEGRGEDLDVARTTIVSLGEGRLLAGAPFLGAAPRAAGTLLVIARAGSALSSGLYEVRIAPDRTAAEVVDSEERVVARVRLDFPTHGESLARGWQEHFLSIASALAGRVR